MDNKLPVGVVPYLISDGDKKNVWYPQVFGVDDAQFQQTINHEIIAQVQQLIETQSGEDSSSLVEMIGYYEIKNNQRNVLSLLQSNYAYHYHAAHGNTILASLNYDLETHRSLPLSDLFKAGSDYVMAISNIIKAQIKERGIELISPFTSIAPDQSYYIADKTIVIYFQLYELTPYVYGFPMFPIPIFQLSELINEDGPLGRLSANN